MTIRKILVGYGSCGAAAGADEVYKELKPWANERKIPLAKTGCIGPVSYTHLTLPTNREV